MNHLMLCALALTLLAAGIICAPRCRPGDRGIYIGGAMLVAGCPKNAEGD